MAGPDNRGGSLRGPAPAVTVAQVGNGVGQESESGDVALGFAVSNEGDYASQRTPALQEGNTGNFNNAPGFLQYASESDDFELDLAAEYSNTIQQSSAASS